MRVSTGGHWNQVNACLNFVRVAKFPTFFFTEFPNWSRKLLEEICVQKREDRYDVNLLFSNKFLLMSCDRGPLGVSRGSQQEASCHGDEHLDEADGLPCADSGGEAGN